MFDVHRSYVLKWNFTKFPSSTSYEQCIHDIQNTTVNHSFLCVYMSFSNSIYNIHLCWLFNVHHMSLAAYSYFQDIVLALSYRVKFNARLCLWYVSLLLMICVACGVEQKVVMYVCIHLNWLWRTGHIAQLQKRMPWG